MNGAATAIQEEKMFSMAISDEAQRNHAALFPNHTSTLKVIPGTKAHRMIGRSRRQMSARERGSLC